jgi:hypothetical protein
MGRIFIDGFESGDLGNWDSINGAVAVVSAPSGMSGGYALLSAPSNSSSGYAIKTLVSAIGQMFASFRINFVQTHGNYPRPMRVMNGDTVIFWWEYTTGQSLRFYNGNNTLLGNFGTTLNPGDVYHCEIWYLPHNSTGRLQVKINNVLVLDFTGNTNGTGFPTTINRIWFGQSQSSSGQVYLDDLVIDDEDWVGPSRIAGLLPSVAGNSTNWDPSAGNNYACVDEAPASDADYVSTNVVDEVDTYALSDLPSEAAVIKCVQVTARAQKEGSATPQNLNLAVRTTGGDAYSGDKVIPSSFAGLHSIWEINPGTSSPWTVSEVNAMEAGVKSKT